MTLVQSRLFEPAIAIHVASALLALALGVRVLLARKGTVTHRLTGRGWAAAMAVTAGSSFFIGAQLLPIVTPLGTFGPIHLLSAFTLVKLAQAIAAIRRHDVALHRSAMRSSFAGLAVAGLFTLVPGRTLNAWLMTLAG
jgi:uncharacterized membrane protein